jgi:predicted GTPase
MKRIVIAGAAGRDFHNFNVAFRDAEEVEVVAFTATQIPDIDGRVYPPELAGGRYPNGIPIVAEDDLDELVAGGIDEVVFAYSDVSHEHVMHIGSRALAAGADYRLMGPRSTELRSGKPVVAICAVRTGSGKSQTTRHVARVLREAGLRVAVLRHPMPYGDIARQAVQRFERYEDLDAADCTIEEREEYEPHLAEGNLVFAGVDYGAILARAEEEADVIVWDGGNNDTPFIAPDVHIVVVDPHRAGHERRYHPGETNLRMADVCVVNKVDSAPQEGVDAVLASIRELNPRAEVVMANSPFAVEGDAEEIRGKRVLAIEDGPTLTHGDMRYGAAVLAARQFGAASLVDPRPFAVGSIKETFEKYPHVSELLPAMGYGDKQIEELRQTIEASDADLVLIGTPIDLRRIVELDKPAMRVTYRLEEIGEPTIEEILRARGIATKEPALA